MAEGAVQIKGAKELAGNLLAADKGMAQDLRGAMDDSLALVRGDAERTLSGHGLRRMAGSLVDDISGGGPRLTGTVTSTHPGAIWVERGRRPGRRPPPTGALRGWAQRHGIPADPGTLFLIARAIGRRGIRPRPFLVPALERNRARIVGIFAKMNAMVTARAARGL